MLKSPLQKRGVALAFGATGCLRNYMGKQIAYNPKLKQLAKNLRKNSTLSEVLLWQRIKNKQILGIDFNRQKPIGNYIVDFFCYDMMLVLEIDGATHDLKEEYDLKRLDYLKSLGITVLIFIDGEVKVNPSGVVSAIENWIDGID